MKDELVFFVGTVSPTTQVVRFPASINFTTLGLDLLSFDGPWTMDISRTLATGTPTVTLEVSNDNENWYEFQDESTEIPVPEIFTKSTFRPRYLRVVYVANGATGELTIKFYKL